MANPDVAQAASAPHAEHEGPAYPGTCARRSPEDARNLDAAGRVYSWRFRVTDSPSFIDGFAGPFSIDLRQIGGDFVVWKSSGTPAYQLAVVVDDSLMNVTDVIRGDDLLTSTPRQLLLQQALGYGSPQYVHLPLLVGPDGRRLAKRHGDTRLWTLRDRGLRADVLCGFLAHSLGWQATPAAGPAKDLVKRWNLSGIPRAPYVLTPEAVDAMLALSRR
jgi:glutamyl-tRNA synthetase